MHSGLLSWLILLFTIGVKSTTHIADNEKEKFADFLKKSSPNSKCAICLKKLFIDKPKSLNSAEDDVESFVNKKSLLLCPFSFKHIFHRKCLVRWYCSSSVCPTCRKPIETDLFDKYESERWQDFYNLNQDAQKELIEELRTMNVKYLVKVFKIFKFHFGENKLTDLKNFIPIEEQNPRIVKLIDEYKKENVNDFVFISNNLTNESLDLLKELFKPEEVSDLKPKDLLLVCKNLNTYCMESGLGESFSDFLNIRNMKKYSKVFSFDELVRFLDLEMKLEGNFHVAKDICFRMRSEDIFDETIFLAYLYENVELNADFNPENGLDFLNCILNFYKLKKIEFYKRLIIFMIKNKEVLHPKGFVCKMKSVFKFVIKSIYKDDYFGINILLDAVIHSNADFNEQSRDNLVEFLLSLFKKVEFDENESADDDEDENSMELESKSDQEDSDLTSFESVTFSSEEESMKGSSENSSMDDCENNSNTNDLVECVEADLEENNLMEDGNEDNGDNNEDNGDEEVETVFESYKSILEHVIYNPVLGAKFLEDFHKKYDSLPNSSFKEQVQYFEKKKG